MKSTAISVEEKLTTTVLAVTYKFYRWVCGTFFPIKCYSSVKNVSKYMYIYQCLCNKQGGQVTFMTNT